MRLLGILIFLFVSIVSFAQKTKINLSSKLYLESIEKKKSSIDEMQIINLLGDFKSIHQLVESLGGSYRYSVGKHHSFFIPISKINQIDNQSFIQDIDLNFPMGQNMNDTMRAQNNVIKVQNGVFPLQQAYSGKGVLIGVIDDGFDVRHPDFYTPEGDLRVLSYWDQTNSDNSSIIPPKYGYGQLYSMEGLLSLSDLKKDLLTSIHGTNVAGAAAGNANGNGTHLGVAPEADLIFIRTDFSRMNWETTVAEAVDYIFSEADRLGVPCVINASVGNYLGSHDGTDFASYYIDSLLAEKPGRIMVCAGGNSGNWDKYHLGYEVSEDTTFTWLKSGYTPFGFQGFYLDMWANENQIKNIHFAIGVNDPSNDFKQISQSTFFSVDDLNNTILNSTLYNGITEIGDIQVYASKKGDLYHLEFSGKFSDKTKYYSLITTGQGTFDAWAGKVKNLGEFVTSNLPSAITYPPIEKYRMPDLKKTIVSSWACSPNVVTVGNYVNATQYIDVNGNIGTASGVKGKIAASSSFGPSRTGHLKPDISAPGDLTLSAWPLKHAKKLLETNPEKLGFGGLHGKNGGTSMASPGVAGIAALFLEKCGTATHKDFLNYLKAKARADNYTGSVPNTTYGYGKADGFELLKATNFDINLEVFEDQIGTSTLGEYQWLKEEAVLEGEILSSLVAPENGVYSVEITNKMGCSMSSQGIEIKTVGVEILELGIQSIHVNSEIHQLIIQGTSNMKKTSFSIYNSIGKTIQTGTLLPNIGKLTIDLVDLSSGVHIVRLNNHSKSTTYKFFSK